MPLILCNILYSSSPRPHALGLIMINAASAFQHYFIMLIKHPVSSIAHHLPTVNLNQWYALVNAKIIHGLTRYQGLTL